MFSQKPSKRAGLSVFKPARENGFGIRVLVVAAVLSVFEARRLMQAGAAGVFLKQNPPNLLVDAIRSVMGGQPYIDPALRDYLRSDAEPRNSPETLPSLQYAMLSAVMEGLANKEWEIPLWNNVRCPLSKPDLVAESVTYVSKSQLCYSTLREGLQVALAGSSDCANEHRFGCISGLSPPHCPQITRVVWTASWRGNIHKSIFQDSLFPIQTVGT